MVQLHEDAFRAVVTENNLTLSSDLGSLQVSVVGQGVGEVTAVRQGSLERFVWRTEDRATVRLLRALVRAFQFVQGKDAPRRMVKQPGRVSRGRGGRLSGAAKVLSRAGAYRTRSLARFG